MSAGGFVPVLRRFLGRRNAELTADAVLLKQFTRAGDESAFAGLVQRHGPMVWGVCRRVLRQEQAAEDAFQATFLVLARKARSIRSNTSLAGWLYRVALRLALAARQRLNDHPESLATEIPDRNQVEPATDLVHREVRQVLDEEIRRLPERYRLPVILCFFQGRTHTEAASDLRCPAGTVSGRLARAKELLHARLTRRGITLAGGAVGTLLAAELTQAAPSSVVAAATTAGPAFVLSPSPPGRISLGADALAQGLLRAERWHRLSLAVTVLLAVSLVAGWATWKVFPSPTATPVPIRAEKPAEPEVTLARRPARNRIVHEGGVIVAVAASPDGRTIASAGWDRAVKLWDGYTGLWMATLAGHGAPVKAVAFSPDGARLAAGGEDGKIKVWDLRKGKELATFTGHSTSVIAVAFAPDGRTLISQHGHRLGLTAGPWEVMAVHMWDMQSSEGRILHEEKTRTNTERWMAVSPDGKTLVTTESKGGATTLTLWDIQGDKKCISSHQVGYESLPWAAFTPDGKTLVLPFSLWDVKTRTETKTEQVHLPGGGRASCFALSPSGDTIAVSGDLDSVLLWDRKTGRTLKFSHNNESAAITSLAFTPDGRTLLSGDSEFLVRLWDVASGTEQGTITKGRFVKIRCARYSPDGRTLWTAGARDDNGVWQPTVWDPQTRKQLGFLDLGKPGREIYSMALSPDGSLIATHDRYDVSLWDARTRKHKFTIKLLQKEPHLWSFRGADYLAFSPDGKILAASCDEKVELWNTATGEALASLPRHGTWVTAVAYSPDGKTVASADLEGTILFWDVPGRKERLRFQGHPQGSMVGLAFSPDGTLLVSGGLGGVKLWDVATGKEKLSLNGGAVVAFSFDGKIIAAVVDGGIRLWATETGKELGTLVGHAPHLIESITFSPDGNTLVSVGGSTVKFWDISPPWNNSPPPRPAVPQR